MLNIFHNAKSIVVGYAFKSYYFEIETGTDPLRIPCGSDPRTVVDLIHTNSIAHFDYSNRLMERSTHLTVLIEELNKRAVG